MLGRLTLPNAITCANIAAGYLALVAVAGGHLWWALLLVVVAAVFDVLDGFLARRAGSESTFGANLDSLADVISFGVVPAFALQAGPLGAVPVLGTAACLAFVVAGAWRLARYPLVKECAGFVGLPIPLAGLLVMVLVVSDPAWVPALVVAVGLSVLMVSPLVFPTVATVARRTRHVGRNAGPRRGRTSTSSRPPVPRPARPAPGDTWDGRTDLAVPVTRPSAGPGPFRASRRRRRGT